MRVMPSSRAFSCPVAELCQSQPFCGEPGSAASPPSAMPCGRLTRPLLRSTTRPVEKAPPLTVIFVHGCFWHRHEGCRYATTPATRPEFWAEKFAANVRRDRAACDALLSDGWRVATIWECALRKPQSVEHSAAAIEEWLLSEIRQLEIGEADPE
jgi:hypothetical protein